MGDEGAEEAERPPDERGVVDVAVKLEERTIELVREGVSDRGEQRSRRCHLAAFGRRKSIVEDDDPAHLARWTEVPRPGAGAGQIKDPEAERAAMEGSAHESSQLVGGELSLLRRTRSQKGKERRTTDGGEIERVGTDASRAFAARSRAERVKIELTPVDLGDNRIANGSAPFEVRAQGIASCSVVAWVVEVSGDPVRGAGAVQ